MSIFDLRAEYNRSRVIKDLDARDSEIEKLQLQIAALRKAGEKMARMLKYVNDMNKQKEIDLYDDWLWAQNSDTGKKILAALAKWEAANKWTPSQIN